MLQIGTPLRESANSLRRRREPRTGRVFGFQSERQRENFMIGRTRFCNGPNREMRRCTALNRLAERIIRSITAMANVRLWIYNRPDLFAREAGMRLRPIRLMAKLPTLWLQHPELAPPRRRANAAFVAGAPLAGLHTRFPVHPECNARTRRGTRCKAPKVAGANRCRHHGGGRMLLRRARQTLATTRSRAIMAKCLWYLEKAHRNRIRRHLKAGERQLARREAEAQRAIAFVSQALREGWATTIWSHACIAPETRSGLIARRTSPVQPELSCTRCLAVSLYDYVSRHSLPNFKSTKTSDIKPLRSSVCDCRRHGIIPEMRTSRSHCARLTLLAATRQACRKDEGRTY